MRLAQGLDWRLAVSLVFGFSGCAAISSNPEAPPDSHFKVTARVVDVASKGPAAAADGPNSQPPAQLPAAAPKNPPGSTEEPSVQEPDRTRPEERIEAAKRFEPPQPAEPTPEEQFLLRVASERPAVPLDGVLNGEAAVVNFVDGDRYCSRLAITYPGRRISEIWRVCADRQFLLERKAEAIPPVPEDPGLEATRLMTVHSAYTGGQASVEYGPYKISAQAGGPADARGCMLIRSALTWEGAAIATRDDTICLPTGE